MDGRAVKAPDSHNQAADRVRWMEQCFDALLKAADENPASIGESTQLQSQLQVLKQYYESGQWLRDYELDEAGRLPAGLKRGVLAQDAVYDFLERISNTQNHGGSEMKVTVEALEAYLQKQYGGWAGEQSLFMKLVEEIGEVAEILNKRTGRKSSDGTDLQEALGKELADVIHYAVAIAAVNQLDLNEIILSKDRQASVKYHHDINLETFIAEQYPDA